MDRSFSIGERTVDPLRYEIRFPDRTVKVEPRVMQLLV